MDLWEPVKQSYLNATDPAQAASYQQQRAENERLYQRGLLAGDPTMNQPQQIGRQPNGQPLTVAPMPTDLWRMLGRTTPLAFLGGTVAAPEVAMSVMGSAGIYNALTQAQHRFGVVPWLELPNPFQ